MREYTATYLMRGGLLMIKISKKLLALMVTGSLALANAPHAKAEIRTEGDILKTTSSISSGFIGIEVGSLEQPGITNKEVNNKEDTSLYFFIINTIYIGYPRNMSHSLYRINQHI